MGQLKLEGSLVAGPPFSTDTFPGGVTTHPLNTYANPKGFQVATGVLTRNLNSIVSPLVFPELGADASVTKATFLYMKSDAPMAATLTTDDGAGGDVVAVVPIQGILVVEFQDAKFLKELAVQGSGKLEYFMCGQS
jgi:hypothetical protein